MKLLFHANETIEKLAAILLSAEWDLSVQEVIEQWENIPSHRRNIYVSLARKVIRKLAELTWSPP